MEITNIQAQIANLISQLSQHTERTSMQNVSTFGYSSYQQGWESNNTWSDHSNTISWEPQQGQHEAYWQPYEEFYATPMQPPQPPPQEVQTNSGSSMDYDQILDVLTSLVQGQENQAKELSELKNQLGEMVEFMEQIQEQSCMEVGDEPETSQTSQNMDEQWLFEEEEDDKATASLEPPLPQPTIAPPPLPQPPKPSMPSTTTKVSPNSIFSDPIPPNVQFSCRFMQSKEEEGEKGIFETVQTIREKEVAGECLELVKEEIGVDHKATALKIFNLAKCTIPRTFEVVFVLEFSSDHTGKPPPRISISFYTNKLLMIQAPTLEFKPLPDHFNYHLPFKDKREVSSGCTTLKKALLGRQPMQSTKEDLESAPIPDLRP